GAFEQATQGTYLGKIRRVTPSGDAAIPVFTLATPENFGGGVMAMVLPGETFQSIFDGAHLDRGYAYAVAPPGETFSYPSSVYAPSGEDGPIPNATPLSQVQQALHSSAPLGSATGESLGHRKVLSAWATVPSTGWKVFVERPENAVFASLQGKIWRTA